MDQLTNLETLTPTTDMILLDGHDGGGKGTLAGYLTTELTTNYGYDVIRVGYPHYQLPWGKRLAEILTGDLDFTIRDKMLTFALNRLETTHAIHRHMAEQKAKGIPSIIVSDRCPTSNVLTLAYDLFSRGFNMENLEKDFSEKALIDWYEYMMQIDSIYMGILNFPDDWSIQIALLPEDELMRRLRSDSSRSYLDKHEVKDVQVLASSLYRKLANLYPNRFNILDQYDSETQAFRSPQEIASQIFTTKTFDHNDRQGNAINMDVTTDDLQLVQPLIISHIAKFGSDAFQQYI